MSQMSTPEWRGTWITASRSDADPLPVFRKSFVFASVPGRAVLHISGLGHYEARINGVRVGGRELDPGWTNYRRTVLYGSYDVTALLREGENVLGVLLGQGMYHVFPSERYTKFTGSFGPLKLIAQLDCDGGDVTGRAVRSDESWRTAPGPLTFSCIYGGEDIDARSPAAGFDLPGFDDSGWARATACEGPGGELRPQEAPPITVRDTHPATYVRTLPDGRREYDTGVNLSGRPVVSARGPAGATVTVECAEIAGQPWPGHRYRFTLRGAPGGETFCPRFTYFGFQYLYLTVDESVAVTSVSRDFLTSAAEDAGRFECSDELVNRIDAAVERSVRSNLVHTLTDCPHREKLGWQEVVHLMGPSILYKHRAEGLYRKILRDLREGQFDDGFVSGVCPDYVHWGRDRNFWVMSAEWGSSAVQTPWLLYSFTEDRAVLEESFESMSRYCAYLASTRNDAGLVRGYLGDWFDWSPVESGSGHNWYRGGEKQIETLPTLTPKELIATAYLVDNARITARTARLLGVSAAPFDAIAEEATAAFRRAYFAEAAPDDGRPSVASNSQAALATALYFDLVPAASRLGLLGRLVESIERSGHRPTVGEVCWPTLIRALSEEGRADVVYRMIDRTDKPGYGYMLAQGFQTLSETWDGPGTSMNHCMFGHIQEWFFTTLLGIRQMPGSVGFEHPLLAAQPVGNLTHAAGHYDSARGRISSAWRRDGDRFVWTVTVPSGVPKATVRLPGEAGSGDGRDLTVGPGRHEFACRLQAWVG